MDALQFRLLGAPTISTRPAGVADAASTEVRLTRQLQALLVGPIEALPQVGAALEAEGDAEAGYDQIAALLRERMA